MNFRIAFLFALTVSLPFQNFCLSPKAQACLKIAGGTISGIVAVGAAGTAAHFGLERYKNSIKGGTNNFDFSLLISLMSAGIAIPSSILAYIGIKSGVNNLNRAKARAANNDVNYVIMLEPVRFNS